MRSQRLAFGAVLLLALACILLARLSHTNTLARAKDTETLPRQIGLWQGNAVDVDERTFELLGTQDVLILEYEHPEYGLAWLAAVQAAENRAAFHPPELCYVGSNYEVQQKSVASVAHQKEESTVNRLLLTREGIPALLAYYWFVSDSKLQHNYYMEQIRLVSAQLAGRPASGLMVRVSVPVGEAGVNEAENRLQDLVQALLGHFQGTEMTGPGPQT
ncbi:MAG: EpsI family protein [Candidatus Omnitrophica bacterium]|nr:EpsI family protein [Candidatus Omnitrophota bacterium]